MKSTTVVFRSIAVLFVGVLSTLATTENPNTPVPEQTLQTEHQDGCKCTAFYLCNSYTPEANGGELIDIRINLSPCKSYLDVCCNDTSTVPVNDRIPSSAEGSLDPILPNESSDNNKSGCMCAPNEEEYDNEQNGNKNTTPVFDKNIDSGNHIVTSSESSENHGGVTSESTENHGVTSEPIENPTVVTTEPTENRITTEPTDVHDNSNSSGSNTSEDNPTENHTNEQDDDKCGVWNKRGVGFRIKNAIDGESQYGEYPSMMVVFKETVSSKDGEKKLLYHCGGSLIGKNVVLTAAHCVINQDPSKIVLRAGEWDLKTEKEMYPYQDRRVSKIVTHPAYYSGGLYNDVALIFSEEPFKMQENIKIMCLPHEDESFTDTNCFSSGWGKIVYYNNYTIVKRTNFGSTSEIGHYEVNILKNVELPIVSRENCMAALRTTRLGPKFELHKSFICAGGVEGKDTCKGDGGSPLMCPSKEDPNYLVQAGIVSWGIQCGINGIPAAYVNVAGFRNWIDKEIENHHVTP